MNTKSHLISQPAFAFVRHGSGLHLREIADGNEALHVQDWQDDFGATHRSRAGGENFQDRQERCAGQIYFQIRQAVPGVPRAGQEGQDHLRVPTEGRGVVLP